MTISGILLKGSFRLSMPIDAVILLGMMTGSSLNFAGAVAGIVIFGSEAVLRCFIPCAIVSLTIIVA